MASALPRDRAVRRYISSSSLRRGGCRELGLYGCCCCGSGDAEEGEEGEGEGRTHDLTRLNIEGDDGGWEEVEEGEEEMGMAVVGVEGDEVEVEER